MKWAKIFYAKIKLFDIIHLQSHPSRNYFQIKEHGRYSCSEYPISIKLRLTDYVTRYYCHYYIEWMSRGNPGSMHCLIGVLHERHALKLM